MADTMLRIQQRKRQPGSYLRRAQILGDSLQKGYVLPNIFGIRKFQKTPSKTHGRSNNSYNKTGQTSLQENQKGKNEFEKHESETGWNIYLTLDLVVHLMVMTTSLGIPHSVPLTVPLPLPSLSLSLFLSQHLRADTRLLTKRKQKKGFFECKLKMNLTHDSCQSPLKKCTLKEEFSTLFFLPKPNNNPFIIDDLLTHQNFLLFCYLQSPLNFQTDIKQSIQGYNKSTQ